MVGEQVVGDQFGWEKSVLDITLLLVDLVEELNLHLIDTGLLLVDKLSEVSIAAWFLAVGTLHEEWVGLEAWVVSDVLDCLGLELLNNSWLVFNVGESDELIW